MDPRPTAPAGKATAKERYRELRDLPLARLWEEAARFESLPGRERVREVALLRALAVAVDKSDDWMERERARDWLRRRLDDPEEKVRRYALAQLPKLSAGREVEERVVGFLGAPASEREREAARRALAKIGGEATLAKADPALLGADHHQRVAANAARHAGSTTLALDRQADPALLARVLFHGKAGLEELVAEEVAALGLLAVRRVTKGCVEASASRPLSLADLYRHRCFATLGFVVAEFPCAEDADPVEPLAAAIAAPGVTALLAAMTDGPRRYRIDFATRGHQRGLVKRLAARVHALEPGLLNDPHLAPWTVSIADRPGGRLRVELVPRPRPDPRQATRAGDIPAASHPALAACLARAAAPRPGEIAWDPFCGSGMELVECLRLEPRCVAVGTDREPGALAVARRNAEAAGLTPRQLTLARAELKGAARAVGITPGSVGVIVTNPPMGRRVPVPDLEGLVATLFDVAAATLRPGGRLVFLNPLATRPRATSLRLRSRRKVDLGGFHAHLELYELDAAAQDGRKPHRRQP